MILDKRGQKQSWRINRWENPIVVLIAFSLSINETYFLTYRKIINFFDLYLLLHVIVFYF